MSTQPVGPVAGAPAPVAPAPKLTAIQLIEQEIGGFLKQREQAIANVHAVEGAIQAGQHLLNRLKQEAAKAEAEVKKLVTEAVGEGEKVVQVSEAEAATIEQELGKALGTAVKVL